MRDWIEAIVGAICLFGTFYICLVVAGVLYG